MLTLVIIILGAAFLLYTLLGGADFGAGIIEIFAGKREEVTISRAIAPVWEANHVWLILAVVILFMGFPDVYSSLSVVLHIPLMVVLIGIIIRGTAFTFRHYDVVLDKSHKYYTLLFRISSLITPVFLGVILGAMMLGRITFNISGSFYEVFLAPWLNIFCFTMGIFAMFLFAYISATFLVGETTIERERKMYVRLSRRFMIGTMIAGLLVFVAASGEELDLLKDFLNSKTSIFTLLLATVISPAIWHFLNRQKDKTVYLRIGVSLQVMLILVGWFAIQFPVLIKVNDGISLTFFNTQAPEATLQQLLIALLVGLVVIIPGFVFLFKVFKIKNPAT
jgi:cytochrome bd ubiquinol oxidase subunit II